MAFPQSCSSHELHINIKGVLIMFSALDLINHADTLPAQHFIQGAVLLLGTHQADDDAGACTR